jgi:hypothetical protein
VKLINLVGEDCSVLDGTCSCTHKIKNERDTTRSEMDKSGTDQLLQVEVAPDWSAERSTTRSFIY